MADPEFRNDENVLVRTAGVYVKSIPFEGILTNKRIILIDRAKNLLPQKEIPLSTIRDVATGENAIRDQTLTLSVLARTGEARQMILTFSRREGGNRIKERDDWARLIRENLSPAPDPAPRRIITTQEAVPRRAEPAASPRISIVATSQPASDPDLPHPVRRETESVPAGRTIPGSAVPSGAPPARDFDAPPLGQSVFCSRCGNRVPSDSAFCNRCGSPIVVPGQAPPVSYSAPTSPASPAPPVSRPIDREIQEVEPLIERSSAKIPPDPLRVTPEPQARSASAPVSEPAHPVPEEEAPAFVPPPAAPAEKPQRKGILPRLFSPRARTQAAPRSTPSPRLKDLPPLPPEKPRGSSGKSKKMLMTAGLIVVVILVIAAAAMFVYPMLTSGSGISLPSESSGTTPTPSPTPAATSAASSSSSSIKPGGTIVPVETVAVEIPPTGIYVHVNYIGGYKGTYGAPDALVSVPGNSGERVWEVENVNSTVKASFEKLDGSSHELLVEIYKNGVSVTKGTTKIGHGSVALSMDAKTGVAATPVTSG